MRSILACLQESNSPQAATRRNVQAYQTNMWYNQKGKPVFHIPLRCWKNQKFKFEFESQIES